MTTETCSPLIVTQRYDAHGGCELRVVGDVDLSSLPVLAHHIEQVLTTSPSVVAFELAGVGFMDSSGIGALLQVADTVPAVVLVNPSVAVTRLVELAGLASVLPITQSPRSPVAPVTS